MDWNPYNIYNPWATPALQNVVEQISPGNCTDKFFIYVYRKAAPISPDPFLNQDVQTDMDSDFIALAMVNNRGTTSLVGVSIRLEGDDGDYLCPQFINQDFMGYNPQNPFPLFPYIPYKAGQKIRFDISGIPVASESPIYLYWIGVKRYPKTPMEMLR